MPTSDLEQRDAQLDQELAGLDALELAQSARRPLPRRALVGDLAEAGRDRHRPRRSGSSSWRAAGAPSSSYRRPRRCGTR